MAEYEELQCPFCKETDFDAIGLKQHLINGWCGPFVNTEWPKSQMAPLDAASHSSTEEK